MTARYLSETPEFADAVERRMVEAMRRAAVERYHAEAMRRAPLLFRIIRVATDDYLSELRHMLDAPIYFGPGR